MQIVCVRIRCSVARNAVERKGSTGPFGGSSCSFVMGQLIFCGEAPIVRFQYFFSSHCFYSPEIFCSGTATQCSYISPSYSTANVKYLFIITNQADLWSWRLGKVRSLSECAHIHDYFSYALHFLLNLYYVGALRFCWWRVMFDLTFFFVQYGLLSFQFEAVSHVIFV